jgi:hypothetical protein
VSGQGEVYYAIDAGNDGISSILVHNGFGFHEVYRAPHTGWRIHGMGIDATPGEDFDRLMFSMGSDIVYMPLSQDPQTHPIQDYNFYPFSLGLHTVTFPWIYNGRRAIEKLYKDVEVITEFYGTTHAVYVWYRLDDTEDWTFHGSASSYHNDLGLFSADYTTRGRRIQLMLGLSTRENEYSPSIEAIVLHSMMKTTKTWGYTIQALVMDSSHDLDGNADDNLDTFALKDAKLQEWDASPIAVYVKGGMEFANGVYCIVDLSSYVVLEYLGDGKYLVQLRLVEIE